MENQIYSSDTAAIRRGEMKPRLLFCTAALPEKHSQLDTLLLLESFRAFGGKLANSPFWVFTVAPARLDPVCLERIKELNGSLLPIKVREEKSPVFFHERLQFLDQGERKAAGKTDVLIWMDANTLVMREPHELAIAPGKIFGYRPVHHLLIGSRIGEPLNPFWDKLFWDCKVPAERVFPMRPVVETVKMRPYMNAGLLVTRPERGFFRHWYGTFQRLYKKPIYQEIFEEDPRYKLFFHQAVLTGDALHFFDRQEMMELPAAYNYPQHLHAEDITTGKPAGMETMATIRHERFYEKRDWKKTFPAGEDFKGWLSEKLDRMQKLM
jgi:hypothetical protein